MSNQYLARDVQLDEPVLIEVLQTTVNEDPDLAARFRKRMETVSQIKHPNIAPVIEIGVTPEGFPYAVIEYIAGATSLAEREEKWRQENNLVSVEDALMIIRQIADALSVAHSAGLVHHDLRPENIVLKDGIPPMPILADLGVPIVTNPQDAVLVDSQPEMLDYASPEELEGKTISRRSNIYSLGIILYELLTGHRPKLPASSWDIFERATMPKEVPLEEAREGLSGETYRLVRNCLWRQEWSRFETADELMTAIDTAILAEQSLPKEAATKRRNWMYVAAPIVAIIVLLLGFLLVRGQFVNADQGGASPDKSPTAIAGGIPNQTPTNTPAVTPVETITPLPATNISLFRPVDNSEFSTSSDINFAWIWLTLPGEDEQFAVYMAPKSDESEPVLVGTVTEPDDASLYLLQKNVSELGLAAGTYFWQVQLENEKTGDILAKSSPRLLIILPDTPTPTLTPTLTPTPTGTTAVSPTPTASEECVPRRPPGWLEHRVQAGETPSTFAERANVPVQLVLDANCLEATDVLSIGQRIFIPPPLATDTPTPSPLIPTSTPGGGGGGNGGDGGGSSPTATPVPPTPEPTQPPVPTIPPQP